MPTGLIAAIAEFISDLAWYHFVWGDDWGWRRIIAIAILGVILTSLSYYFLGLES
ncbi:MAG: hypothetical protein IID08_00565 [Candidatus Hydrogenedentes bacterium]|nr:hypothetical protein [Candidatus Hydrogenedentota bacterium]